MTRLRSALPLLAALAGVLAGALLPAAATDVPAGTISTDTTWSLAGSPYVLLGTVTVEGTDGPDGITTLTIEPGVEVRCAVGAFALRVGVNAVGALQAGGTGLPTVFRSNGAGARGDWQGVQFQTRARASTLSNVLVQHAGRAGGPGAAVYFNSTGNVLTITGGTQVSESALAGVQVANGTVNMAGGSISSNTGVGFRVGGGTATLDGVTLSGNSFDLEFTGGAATIQNSAATSVNYTATTPAIAWANNTFTSWGQVTSVVDPDDVGALSNNGNTFSKAGGAVTRLLAGDVARDQSWNAVLSPYVMAGTIEVRGTDGPDGVTTLTLQPGLAIRSDGVHLLRIGLGTAGALQADGVTFQHNSSSSAGAWYGVHFQTSARSSRIANSTVRHAGAGALGGIYSQMPAGQTLTIDNVTVETTAARALYSSSSALTVTGGSFSGNAADGINVAGGTATLSDVTAASNGSNGVAISGGTVTVDGGTFTANGGGDFEISGGGGTIQDTAANSVVYTATGGQFAWTGNTFTNYGQVTSAVDPDDLGSLSGNNTFSKIAGAVTRIIGGDVARDQSWSSVLSPYILAGIVEVRGTDGPDGVTTLTLPPGSTIRAEGVYLLRAGLGTPGALQVDGVTFQHDTSSSAGAWYGVHFHAAARSSRLADSTVRHAGAGGLGAIYSQMPAGQTLTLENVTVESAATRALYSSASTLVVTGGSFSNNANDGIQVAGGNAALTNVTLTGNGADGLAPSAGTVTVTGCTLGSNSGHDVNVSGGSGTVGTSTLRSVFYGSTAPEFTWTGNTFQNWGAKISRIDPDDLGSLTSNNTFSLVTGAVTEVIAATVAKDNAWTARAGVLNALGNLTVQGTAGPDARTTLALGPGVTLRFPQGTGMRIGAASGAPGELVIDGTIGQDTYAPITLTTSKPVPAGGDWTGIYVLETGSASITSALVRWATTALRVDGTLQASRRLSVNRATTGVNFTTAAAPGICEYFDFRNVDTAVQSANTTPAFSCSNLTGRVWGVNNTTTGSPVAAGGNWWGDPSGPSGQGGGSGSTVSAGVTFAPWLNNPCDDGDAVAQDDGDGVFDPCTNGNTEDCDDNCPRVANAAQRDADRDGVGDACDNNPELTVSNDPADGADFPALQPAVDAAVQSGTRILLYPGAGPYLESVLMDRFQTYQVLRFEDGTGEPAVVDGGTQPAFVIQNGAGAAPILLNGLTLRGSAGVDPQVGVDAVRVAFEFINGPALKVASGTSRLIESSVAPSVTLGAEVANGAELTVERTRMEGQTDAGVRTAGKVTLVNTLIGGGKDGVRLTANTGNATVRYSTIANNTGLGIANQVAGTVTVERSIVARNATDLQNVACANLSWSITQNPNCSAINNNRVGDPLLAADYTLQAASPCLDHGPAPSLYTGSPGTDLDGGQRLLDFDGDGFAYNDCGAFEMLGAPAGPADIQNLRWQDAFTLVWDPDPLATQYHLYSGDVAQLSYASYGACRDDLDLNRADTQAQPAANPPLGKALFYVVTGEDDGGREGTLGFGTSAERSNYVPCP